MICCETNGVVWAEEIIMYSFVSKKSVQPYKSLCSDKMNQLKMNLSNNFDIECEFELIGSGARNLVTQNAAESYDLDYNLIIYSMSNEFWDNPRKLKDAIREELNKILGSTFFRDAQDSTSVLTARLFFKDDPKKKEFSFDIGILVKNRVGNFCRLIHEKSFNERFYWNEVPESHNVSEKSDELKKYGWWEDVRDAYLELKNMYLSRNDCTHPSFIIYVEAVNQVYNEFENYEE